MTVNGTKLLSNVLLDIVHVIIEDELQIYRQMDEKHASDKECEVRKTIATIKRAGNPLHYGMLAVVADHIRNYVLLQTFSFQNCW